MKVLSSIVCLFLFVWLGAWAAEKIDINTASLEELQKIKWVGPVIAQRIIDTRPFYSVEELIKVNGIGEKKLADIKVQGFAWVDPNFQPILQVEPKPQPEAEPKSLEESKLTTHPSGIIINEILPAPQGPDAENEWIEIFNQNNFEVDLSDWKIEDTLGRTTTYTFPQGTKIGPLGFLVFSRPTSKITLNNDADGLNLFQPDGKIIDRVSYEKAPKGESYNKIPAGWVWSTILTSGSENIVSIKETKETGETTKDASAEVGSLQIIDINTASLKELQKLAGIGPALAQRIIEARPFYSVDELTKVSGIGPKTLEDIKKQGLAWVDPKLAPPKTEKTESLERGLATLAEPLRQTDEKQTLKPLLPFLVAFGLAISSGTIILLLKNKLKKNYNKNI